MRLIQPLASKELVRNLPKLKFDQHFCDACKIGKQAHASHKAKNVVSMTRCLELLYMDLFGPSAVRSYRGNRYILVIVDDYSSKAYIVLNKRTKKVEESLNVTFDETPPPSKTSPLVDDDLDEEEAIKKASYVLKQAPKACLTCQDMCDEFSKIMHDEFKMSMMGELNFFLGLQIKQMEDGTFFNQSTYIKEMLKIFGLEDSKPMKTSMSSDAKLTKDEECESVDSTKYRGIIGSLLYLTTSRLDIMFSVCLCARFQEAPKSPTLKWLRVSSDTLKALRT
nr:retrovirus-related Pol polyprotein from transposon TNT 1-94 [Tanacetum cinerariifolium]